MVKKLFKILLFVTLLYTVSGKAASCAELQIKWEGGKASALAAGEGEAMLTTVQYKDGEMTSIDIVRGTLPLEGAEQNLKYLKPEAGSNTVRAFLWGKDLKPIAKSEEMHLQYFTPFTAEYMYSGTAKNREGLPYYSRGEAKGEGEWYWADGVKSENVTTFFTEGDNRAFHISKNAAVADAAILRKGGAPAGEVSRIETSVRLNISALEGGGVLFGIRGAIVFKREGEYIVPCYIEDISKSKSGVKPFSDTVKALQNEWFNVKTILTNKLTSEGYESETTLYINGTLAGTFKNIYNDDIAFNNAYFYLDSFDDTTFSLMFDDIHIAYAANDSLDMIDDSMREALSGLERICDESIINWLYEMYDPESGGFYHSMSSRDSVQFAPCLEATEFAVNIMKATGLFTEGTYPEALKSKMISFTKNMQKSDGYFYDAQWEPYDAAWESRKNRDLMWAKSILGRFGESPVYPYPGEEAALLSKSSTLPDYLQSEEKFIKYLDSHDWSEAGIWSTGNALSSASALIKSAGLLDTAREYIVGKQNKATGLWGDGCTMNNINGAMKLASFFGTDFPYPDIGKMTDSVLYVLENENLTLATSLWNPISLLDSAIKSHGKEIPFKVKYKVFSSLPDIIVKLENAAKAFKKSDGGYSSFPQNSVIYLQGPKISLGLCESDMDGTTIIGVRLTESVYSILNMEKPKYFEKHKDEFISRLLAKEAY